MPQPLFPVLKHRNRAALAGMRLWLRSMPAPPLPRGAGAALPHTPPSTRRYRTWGQALTVRAVPNSLSQNPEMRAP